MKMHEIFGAAWEDLAIQEELRNDILSNCLQLPREFFYREGIFIGKYQVMTGPEAKDLITRHVIKGYKLCGELSPETIYYAAYVAVSFRRFHYKGGTKRVVAYKIFHPSSEHSEREYSTFKLDPGAYQQALAAVKEMNKETRDGENLQ